MKAFFSVVLVVVSLAFAYVIREYANVEYQQLDVATAILCENAAKFGRADIIEKLEPYVKNRYAKESIVNSSYYAKNYETDLKQLIANRPKEGRLSVRDNALANEIIRRYCSLDRDVLRKKSFELEYATMFLANTPIKAKIFYILGVKLENKDYISAANEIVNSMPIWGIEYTDTLLDIAEFAINAGNVEDFFKYMDITPYSLRKAGMYYLVCKDQETLKKTERLFRNKEMSSSSQWNMRAILPSTSYLTKNINIVYSIMDNASIFVYQGGSSYKLRKNKTFKYPSILLLSYMLKEKSLEEGYYQAVFSDETFNGVKIRYLEYVQYTNVVCRIIDKQSDIPFLLDRVANQLQREKLCKKTVRLLSENGHLLDCIAIRFMNYYDTSALYWGALLN